MLTLKRKKYGLTLAEVFFFSDPDAPLPRADIRILVQSSSRRGRWREFHTLHLDLSMAEDDLLGRCSKNNRYKIKRAGNRDGLTVETSDDPSEAEIGSFLEFYDRFSAAKGLSRGNRPKLGRLGEAGGLRLSRVLGPDGEDLCYHVHIADGARARLLYSASHFRESEDSGRRSLIGRANRYLHWADILQFKRAGLGVYDLGGLALNPDDEATQRIDEFKLSFGGSRVTEYNCVEAGSFLGKVALAWVARGYSV